MNNALVESARAFIFFENSLLDSGEYDHWLSLFKPDARYWVPAHRDQQDADYESSIICEDTVLLQMRIGRMLHPRAHGMERPIQTTRITGNIRLVDHCDSRATFEGSLIVNEWQANRSRTFAGRVRYQLDEAAPWLIAEKRIDLVNANAAFDAIQILL